MRRDCGMTPQMVFEHVNRTFREAVYVTDVGTASDVGNTVPGVGFLASADHIRRTWHDGIWISGGDRGKDRQPG